MLNLAELMDIGCVQTMVDSDGWMYPCGKNIAAIRRWPDEGDGKASAASANSTPNRPVLNSCR